MYLLAKILRSYGVLDISESSGSAKVTYEELDGCPGAAPPPTYQTEKKAIEKLRVRGCAEINQ